MNSSPHRLLPLVFAAAFPLAVRAQQFHYDATDLGVVPGASPIAGVTCESMSPNGTFVVGGSWDPYRWSAVGGMQRLPLPSGQVAGLVVDVDDAGRAVGYAGLSAPPNYRATTWDALGTLQVLHQPGWVWSRVEAIGTAGEMLLSVAVPNSTSLGESHAYLRDPAGNYLDLTPTSTSGRGLDLARGFALYVDGNTVRRRDPGGATTSISSAFSAVRIGASGEVLGLANGDVARWSPSGSWQPVADPNLRLTNIGGMNRFGQIVATHSVQYQSSPPRFFRYAHLYTDGLGWVDLATVVDPSRFITVTYSAGITDEGVIAAEGSIGPDNRAMRLVPRFVTTIGQGCPDATGEEVRALVAGEPRGGRQLALLGAGGVPGGMGAFLLGEQSAAIALPGGCTLQLDPAFLLASLSVTSTERRASFTLPLPPALSNVSFYVQYGVLDPGAANGVFALSNAVRVDVQ